MSAVLLLSGLTLWAGATLLLGELRWCRRPPVAERVRPYVPTAGPGRRQAGVLSVESFAETVGPLSRSIGERLSRLLGVGEDLDTRLRRVHAPVDATAYRVRQVGATVAALGAAALAALALAPPAPVTIILLAGAPLLAFLVLEQRVALESARWQRRAFLELPVVAEQLAVLLSAGHSLHGALHRVAVRGDGCCARDLASVSARIRQGLSEGAALYEWAETLEVDAVDRLVAVLALDREASDLGGLLAAEAATVRQEVQRQLAETMDRRAQQVWVPVTVAALLPGTVFLLVPFIEAVRFFVE